MEETFTFTREELDAEIMKVAAEKPETEEGKACDWVLRNGVWVCITDIGG